MCGLIMPAGKARAGGSRNMTFLDIFPSSEHTSPRLPYSMTMALMCVGAATRRKGVACRVVCGPGRTVPLQPGADRSRPSGGEGDLSYMYNTDDNIGSLSNILYSRGLVYAPAEIDTSIRPGWFGILRKNPILWSIWQRFISPPWEPMPG